jgi:DNA uptake protein ComE-like DNA-binding protein
MIPGNFYEVAVLSDCEQHRSRKMNVKSKVFIATKLVLISSMFAGMTFLASCNNPPPSDQHLQEQAAQATEAAKQQSKEALAQARVAAANAERTVDDVAAGVKQGLDSKNAPASSGRLDLNDASEADLASLPGISVGKARQIVQHRPYTSTHDLVKSGLLTEQQFDDIAPKVTVR